MLQHAIVPSVRIPHAASDCVRVTATDVKVPVGAGGIDPLPQHARVPGVEIAQEYDAFAVATLVNVPAGGATGSDGGWTSPQHARVPPLCTPQV